MAMNASRIFRVLLTLLVVASGGLIVWRLWDFYTQAPWTRDARVQANVISVAPDVSGLVADIRVVDNQDVARGDVLFVLDPDRFNLAVRQAEAQVASATQAHTLAQDDFERNKSHGG